jgi:hypothetical protein
MHSLYLAPVAWVDGRHHWIMGPVQVTRKQRRRIAL